MKFSKRDIVQKLVVVPKKARRAFWAKQMAIFNKLLEKFPPKTQKYPQKNKLRGSSKTKTIKNTTTMTTRN